MRISMNAETEVILKSEASLHTILNHADSGYVLYNAELEIIAYNALAQKFAQLLYKKNLVEGHHLLYYFPKDRHDALLDITARVLNGEEISYEASFDVGEDKVWIEVRWLNVKNAENKNWGFILASKDISEIKRAAIEREKMINDLVRRNSALEQFANITSHNLRAPVANIISLVRMMDLAVDEAEKRQFLDFILSSSGSLNKVIDDIHNILEVKQHFLEVRQKIHFEQLVDDVKAMVRYIIIQENVLITWDFDKVRYIYSIRSFLYSVFYNLILNSIKYRRVGVRPEIHIASAIHDDKIRLTFTDNGKGIDLEKNGANLFGLYKRFDKTVDGCGLGLFMVKQQVEELGGTIAVESELGSWTTFTVELPA